jgi:hypothetical protein
MRSNFSVPSQELNDKIYSSYENLVYLLGSESGATHYSGLYEMVEDSGLAFTTSISGIPSFNNPKIITMLKFDYFYRKEYGEIHYEENE